jgi:hypothetical protein
LKKIILAIFLSLIFFSIPVRAEAREGKYVAGAEKIAFSVDPNGNQDPESDGLLAAIMLVDAAIEDIRQISFSDGIDTYKFMSYMSDGSLVIEMSKVLLSPDGNYNEGLFEPISYTKFGLSTSLMKNESTGEESIVYMFTDKSTFNFENLKYLGYENYELVEDGENVYLQTVESKVYSTLDNRLKELHMEHGTPWSYMIHGITNEADFYPIDYDLLYVVVDDTTAIEAVAKAADGLTDEEKTDIDVRDAMVRFAENAMLRAKMDRSESGVVDINAASSSEHIGQIKDLKATIETTLADAGIERNREIETYYGVVSYANPVTINIDASFAEGEIDRVVVLAGDVAATVKKSDIHESFSVSIEGEEDFIGQYQRNALKTNRYGAPLHEGKPAEGANVTFSPEPVNSTIDLGITAIYKVEDKNQTIKNTSNNENVGGVYNPNTNKQDAAIKKSGTYKQEEIQYDFSDISNLTKQAQEAILFLRNKGRVNGTSDTTFSPEFMITRAQFAQMLLYALSENTSVYGNGDFADVPSSEWYANSAGASKHQGYVAGFEDNTFRPGVTIPKEQLVSISGRALGKRHYYIYGSPETILGGRYSDVSSIADWAQKDVALMTQQGCIKYVSDGKFFPADNISRGEAATIIYEVYKKAY